MKYTSCAPCERCLAAIASLGMHVFEWWGSEYCPLEELISEIDGTFCKRDCSKRRTFISVIWGRVGPGKGNYNLS